MREHLDMIIVVGLGDTVLNKTCKRVLNLEQDVNMTVINGTNQIRLIPFADRLLRLTKSVLHETISL